MAKKYYAANPEQLSISEGAITFFIDPRTLEVTGIESYPTLIAKYMNMGLITDKNPRGGHVAPPKPVVTIEPVSDEPETEPDLTVPKDTFSPSEDTDEREEES